MASKVATVVSLLIFGWIAFALADVPQCTEADLKGIYTYCTSPNSTRSLYWYYPDTCNSTGAAPPPDRVDGLPCDIICEQGQYLPYGEVECTFCPVGTYSIGGGERFITWDTWPNSKSVTFNHYCTTASSNLPPSSFICEGWVPNHEYIESGDYDMQNINSVVDISFTLVKEGYVAFSYMSLSPSDRYDLQVQVNFEEPYTLPSSATFQYAKINLTETGTYHVRWIYYIGKDSPDISYARINFLEIAGMAMADNGCTACPAGRYTPSGGSYYCIECNNNEYSGSGAAMCDPCPHNSYSIMGSSSCQNSTTKCTIENDATAYYTTCVNNGGNWERTQYYSWDLPLFCDATGLTLPVNTTVSCVSCPENMVSSSTNYCDTCQSGYASTNNECTMCEAGSAAIPELIYNQWNQGRFPTEMESRCFGRCSENAWCFHQNYISNCPIGNYADTMLSLSLEFLSSGGSVSFDYLFDGDVNATFQVTVDGIVVGDIVPSSDRSFATYEIPFGVHIITWYLHYMNIDDTQLKTTEYIKIYEIKARGTYSGSANTCEECPAGSYQGKSGQSQCTKCPRGYFSALPGATSCTICPENTFAENEGSSSCIACPYGTTSISGSYYCVNSECVWYYPDDPSIFYNLSPFQGQYQFISNEDPYFAGYYALSYCGFLSSETFGCKDSFVCEDYTLFNPFNPAVSYLTWARSVNVKTLDDPYAGYILQYRNGDSIYCQQKPRSVDLYFYCEMDPTKFIALTLDKENTTDCHLVLYQANYYGCPICSVSDFTKVDGECDDGTMQVTYHKNDSITCNGLMKDTTESCGGINVTIGLLLVGSLLLFIVIIGFIAVVYYFYQKNQKLSYKYKELRKTVASSVELDEVDNSHNDD